VDCRAGLQCCREEISSLCWELSCDFPFVELVAESVTHTHISFCSAMETVRKNGKKDVNGN
jgi:hypothetical protein